MNTSTVSLPAAFNDALGALVDGAAAVARMEASLAAMKVEIIERAHRLSQFAENTLSAAGPHRWSVRETARRVVAAELACALKIPERTAQTLLADSDALINRLPATFTSLALGHISWRHAHLMVEQSFTLPVALLAEFETLVLPFAETHTAAQFKRKARTVRERMHPESIDARHEVAVEMRSVDVEPAADGMALLTALLPAATAHAIFDRLDRAASRAHDAGDLRTVCQLRADAFAGALLGVGVVGGGSSAIPAQKATHVAVRGSNVYPIHGPDGALVSITGTDLIDTTPTAPDLDAILASIRPQVQVTVPVLALVGHDDIPATLDGYGPIPLDIARGLVARAPTLTRLLTHPETGAVLSVGRKRYRIPEELRRWLQTRDGTCRFPGCSKKARRCDIDHTQEWHNGGTTAHDNLAHLCEQHHRLKTLTDWKVEQIGNGVLRWTSPTGRIYETEPAEGMGDGQDRPRATGGGGAA